AVGSALRDRVRADVLAAAGAVLDDDRLSPHALQALRENPGDRVRRPSRRQRHDDPHRPIGEALRAGSRSSDRQRARRQPSPFAIRTSVTLFVRLLASTKLPSFVTSVLRTMLPPPGIAQLWNVSFFGSKRTTVFGRASDSLYQMTPLMTEIP